MAGAQLLPTTMPRRVPHPCSNRHKVVYIDAPLKRKHPRESTPVSFLSPLLLLILSDRGITCRDSRVPWQRGKRDRSISPSPQFDSVVRIQRYQLQGLELSTHSAATMCAPRRQDDNGQLRSRLQIWPRRIRRHKAWAMLAPSSSDFPRKETAILGFYGRNFPIYPSQHIMRCADYRKYL